MPRSTLRAAKACLSMTSGGAGRDAIRATHAAVVGQTGDPGGDVGEDR